MVFYPAERRPDAVVGKKLDENGEPLEGAVFGLFAEDGSEPLQTATSDEEGVFSFNITEPGEYIVKEIEAPAGYKLDATEYPISATGSGEIFELEISNTPASGSVKVTLTDAEDSSKNLSGAVFAVYDKDGNKVGELTETSDGVYELGGLLCGEYTVKLEKAPSGYAAGGSWNLTISEDGEVAEIAATAEEEAPPTGDHSEIALYIALIVVALAAIAALIFTGRRKKDTDEPDPEGAAPKAANPEEPDPEK